MAHRELNEDIVRTFVRDELATLPAAVAAGDLDAWLSAYDAKVSQITTGWALHEVSLFDTVAMAEIRAIRLDMRAVPTPARPPTKSRGIPWGVVIILAVFLLLVIAGGG